VAVTICLALLPYSVEGKRDKDAEWRSFKAKHAKQYKSKAHEDHHRAQFEKNANRVAEHNKKFQEGKVSYTLRINQHADQDPVEFHKSHHGATVPAHWKNRTSYTNHRSSRSIRLSRQADSFNWVDQGAVSPVKMQGQCGSCWAFSAMGALESQVMKSNGGQEVDFSTQQLVDCFEKGCGGNWPPSAWDWLQQNGGADSWSDYPYHSTDGQAGDSCNPNNAQAVQQVTGIQQLNMPTDDDTLKNYLQTSGPLSIAVDASKWDPQYAQGTMSCSNPSLDHAVLLVGWASDDSGAYWIIKNSWDTDWGHDGYGHIQMGQGSDCGITQWLAAYPTIN